MLLGLTQVEAGRALGHVRSETVSRWESRGSARVRPLHAQAARYLIEIARMLQYVAPADEDRRRFFNSPQPDLRGKTPRQIMLAVLADSDQGALEHGGRYNPRREFGALYLPGSPAACRVEMQHLGRAATITS